MYAKELMNRMNEIQSEYSRVVETIQKTQKTLQDLAQEKSRLEGAYYEVESIVKKMQSEIESPEDSSTLKED